MPREWVGVLCLVLLTETTALFNKQGPGIAGLTVTYFYPIGTSLPTSFFKKEFTLYFKPVKDNLHNSSAFSK